MPKNKLNKDYFSGANVIWLSNLLFPVEINDKLFKLLSDNIDKNTIVVVSNMQNETYDLKFKKRNHCTNVLGQKFSSKNIYESLK
jgi:hypothetical protein